MIMPPASKPPSLWVTLMAHVIAALVVIGGVHTLMQWQMGAQGAGVQQAIQKLNDSRPDWILLGNSLAKSNLEAQTIGTRFRNKTVRFSQGGMYSAYWYLAVKNIITRLEKKPSLIMIIFRDTDLTEPTYGIEQYRETIINSYSLPEEPTLEEKVWIPGLGMVQNFAYQHFSFVRHRELIKSEAYNLAKKQALVLARHFQKKLDANFNKILNGKPRDPLNGVISERLPTSSFEEQLNASLLPEMLELLQRENITPVFIRSKNRIYLTEKQPREIEDYTQALRTYLQKNGAYLLDYSHSEDIKKIHFLGDDHFNEKGRILLTEMLIKDLRTILR